MKFEYSDAWLLQSIKYSENGDEGATLIAIIQAADYINHAIITNSEFTTGIRKLKSVGLIIEKDKLLRTTDEFNGWWTNKYGKKSRISVLNTMKEIENYLNKNYGAIEEPVTELKTEITDADLSIATAEYHKLTQQVLTKMTKKKKEK